MRSCCNWEQEHIVENEARESKIAGEEKEDTRPPPIKFTMEGLAKAFVDLNKFLKKFKIWTSTLSLTGMFMVQYLLRSKSDGKKNQANPVNMFSED